MEAAPIDAPCYEIREGDLTWTCRVGVGVLSAMLLCSLFGVVCVPVL